MIWEIIMIPVTIEGLLKRIAEETAKVSYPGSMFGRVLRNDNNQARNVFDNYFMNVFPIHNMWNNIEIVAEDYDNWHESQIGNICGIFDGINWSRYPERNYNFYAIGAKFLNTFMSALMKYERFRPLYDDLHLPLDSQVFTFLKRYRNEIRHNEMNSPSLDGIYEILKKNAYSISCDEYREVQKVLLDFIDELNRRDGMEYRIRSRIDLNCLLWRQG